MSDDRRTVEIAIKAEIADLVGPLNAGATAMEQSAARMERSGKKLDAGVASTHRSVGLMGRTMANITSASTKLHATSTALAKHKGEVDKIATSWMIAGGVIAAGAGASLLVMMRFDKAMSGVAATGDDAKQNLDRLGKAAIQAGLNTAYGATEAADGITQLLKAGLSAETVISGGLSASLNLAAADNLDLARSAEIVATALSQFNLKGVDAGHVSDLLAAGAGKAQGGVEDLANGLKYIGPVANGMKISIDDTVGALAALASQGILSEQAGTSLRGVLSSLTSPSKQANAEIERLGITLYDNNGRFLGLANAAEQLGKAYDGTGKLTHKATDEQKDMSLGLLFGNAQLTTARILFAQGKKGLEGWTDAVNDSGYASRAAATQLDNLQGDFKKLKGATEAALITSGGGLNEWARGVTQGATGAVRGINSIPGPVLEAGTRLTALVGIGMLAGGGLLKVATSAAEAKRSMALLRVEAPGVASGLEKTTKAAKRAGIALLALQVLSIFGSSIQSGIDKANGSLGDMAYAAGAAAGGSGLGALDDQLKKVQGQFFGFQTGIPQVKSLGDGLKYAADGAEGFAGWMNGAAGFLEGLVGMKTPFGQVNEQIQKLDSSLATMDPVSAKKAFAQVTTEALAQGVSLEQLSNQFPQYKATLQGVATQLGVTTLTAKDWVGWMGGKVPTAIQAAADASPDAVNAMDDTAQAALNGADAMKQLTESLWGYANAKLKLSGSKMGFEGAIDDAASTVKGNKKKRGKGTKVGNSLSMNYEVNRQNKKSLDELATSSQTYVNTLVEQKGKGTEAVEVMQRARTKYIATAKAAGYGAEQAAQMADDMGLIPANVEADINTKVKKEGINAWTAYKPAGKTAWITPKLTKDQLQAHINVMIKTGKMSADGNLFAGPGLAPQRFANGGYAAIGNQQPQVRRAGGRGLTWAEDGAGPWEAFISGQVGKRKRSRAIASDVVSRLGGVAMFADGGMLRRPPVHSGADARSMAAPTTVINYNVKTTTINPQAEPTSVTNNRALEKAAFLGR